MSGQADTAPESLDDLTQFLVDNPEADQSGTESNRDEPGNKPDNSDRVPGDEPEDDPDQLEEDDPENDPENDPEKDPEGEPDKGRQGLKFKVPVKGEDGADTTIEVDEKELIAGYQRHADYTRKTMELGERERQAFEVVEQRLNEGLNGYAEQAMKAKTAIVKLAQLKTDAEMAQLAAADRDAYVLEDARRRAVLSALEEIDSDMRAAVQQHQERVKGEEAKAFSAAWGVLGQAGINKEKLAGIFGDINKLYGIEKERFAVVKDPRLVLIMRDAAELHKLREKAKGVRQKVQNAPRLPAQRQNVPQSERVSKQVDQRFQKGRAKTGDLASFLMKNPKL